MGFMGSRGLQGLLWGYGALWAPLTFSGSKVSGWGQRFGPDQNNVPEFVFCKGSEVMGSEAMGSEAMGSEVTGCANSPDCPIDLNSPTDPHPPSAPIAPH